MKKIFILIFLTFSCNLFSQLYPDIPKEILAIKAPEVYIATFETSKGDFDVKIERKYSPLAVDRFFQLIKTEYFNNIFFYRCVPDFVVQFGTLNDQLDNNWSKNILIDEPVKMSNDTGTIAFARAGKNTRGTQLFINLKNNSRLDTVSYGETLGFPPFGKVINGMDVIKKLNFKYGDEPRKKLEGLTKDAEQFIKETYPDLDYIKRVYIK